MQHFPQIGQVPGGSINNSETKGKAASIRSIFSVLIARLWPMAKPDDELKMQSPASLLEFSLFSYCEIFF